MHWECHGQDGALPLPGEKHVQLSAVPRFYVAELLRHIQPFLCLILTPLSPHLSPCRAGRYIGGRSDPNDRRYLLRLLIDPKIGLGLTRIRYQIPPGLNHATCPGVWSSCDHDWSSYLLSTTGTWRYNLSADWKQVLAVKVSLGSQPRADMTHIMCGKGSISYEWHFSAWGIMRMGAVEMYS